MSHHDVVHRCSISAKSRCDLLLFCVYYVLCLCVIVLFVLIIHVLLFCFVFLGGLCSISAKSQRAQPQRPELRQDGAGVRVAKIFLGPLDDMNLP